MTCTPKAGEQLDTTEKQLGLLAQDACKRCEVDRLRKFLKRTGVLLVMGSERMVEVEPPTKDNGKAETPLLESPKRKRGRPRKEPA